MIREIAGRQNHSVKLARKLQMKKHRRERGLLVGEGMDLLLAAAAGGADIREILVRRELVAELPPDLRERAAASTHEGSIAGGPAGPAAARAHGTGRRFGAGPLDLGICDQETLDYASSLGGAADVIFLAAQPVGHLSDIDLGAELVFFLAGVGDPGNVGTIVRSAVAFGLGGIICSPGTADPYGPKALRAGMGAQFALPVVTEVQPGDLQAKIAALATRGVGGPRVLVADPQEGEVVAAVRLSNGAVVVLGSERSGPGDVWEGATKITIKQRRFDSLNVAMAGTILAYELSGARAALGPCPTPAPTARTSRGGGGGK